MRTILLMAALAACGGEGAHDVVQCEAGSGWVLDKCERACAARPAGDDGMACRAPIGPGGSVEQCTPNQVAVFDGQRGCCSSGDVGGETGVVFVECEGE